MSHTRTRACGVLLVAGALARGATRDTSAHADSTSCQRAAAALHANRASVNAMQELTRCPSSGPVLLAEIWAQPRARDAMLRRRLSERNATWPPGMVK